MTSFFFTRFGPRPSLGVVLVLVLWAATGYGALLPALDLPADRVFCYTSSAATTDILPLPGGKGFYVATQGGLLLYGASGALEKTYTRKDGLASHLLHQMLMLPDGALWIASSNGAIRFSQGGFRNFSETDGLHHRLVYALAADAEGRLYAGTHKGVSRLENERFIPFPDTHEFARRPTYAIHAAGDGTLWFAKENALNHYLGDRGLETFQRDPLVKGEKNNLPSKNLRAIVTDDDYRPWVGTRLGLATFNGNTWRHWYYPERFFQGKGLPDNRIQSLAFDRDGYLWIGHGYAKDFAGGVGVTFFKENDWHYLTTKEGLPSNCIQRIRIDGDNIKWLATAKGICRISGETLENFMSEGELPGNGVLGLATLGEGKVAVMTGNGPAIFAHGKKISDPLPFAARFSSGCDLSALQTTAASLAEIQAYEPRKGLVDVAGRLWVGARKGGLFFHDQGGWRQVLINGRELPAEITALEFEEEKILWAGSAAEGAFRITLP